MSSIGTIGEELEKPSDLHMVDWNLFIPFVIFVVCCIFVVCALNKYFTDDPSRYTRGPETVYIPPDDPKKSK